MKPHFVIIVVTAVILLLFSIQGFAQQGKLLPSCPSDAPQRADSSEGQEKWFFQCVLTDSITITGVPKPACMTWDGTKWLYVYVSCNDLKTRAYENALPATPIRPFKQIGRYLDSDNVIRL